MSKGGYLGGSVIVRAYTVRSKRLRKGLLALERAELERRKAPEKDAGEPAPSPTLAPRAVPESPDRVPKHIHYRQLRVLRAAHRERRRLAVEAARRGELSVPAAKSGPAA